MSQSLQELMCTSLFIVLIHALKLRNGIILDDNGKIKISKHENSWYYIRFQDHNDFVEITQRFKMVSIQSIGNGYYSAYISSKDAKIIQKEYGIWLSKISSKDKSFASFSSIKSNNYYVLSTNDCKIPGEVVSSSPPLFVVRISEDSVHLLAKTKCIRFFEPVLNDVVFHTRFNRHLTHTKNRSIWHPSLSSYDIKGLPYLSGIDGKGQCVAIADTGIDTMSPWLFDHMKSHAIDSDNLNHRKIKFYMPYGDYADNESGHGTFIAGIIAGKTNCSREASLYDGIASGSRIVFSDIEKNGSLYLPQNITELVRVAQLLKCPVQLNSWTISKQPLLTYLIDSIAFNNPETIMIFPNEGDSNEITNTPADAKNVLTIGGIYSSMISASALYPNAPVFVYPSGMDRPIVGYCDEKGTPLYNSSNLASKYLHMVIDEERQSACVLDDENEKDDQCSLMLVFHDNEIRKRYDIPVIRLPQKWREPFTENLELSVVPADVSSNRHDQFFGVLPESSKTTLYSNRIKPELVAPGGPIIGPKAHVSRNESCGMKGLTSKSGSSVSSAIIAADVLLLSQYFKEKKNINMSSTFIKSSLIASSYHPILHKSDSIAPGFGFGIPNLEDLIKKFSFCQQDVLLNSGTYHTIEFSCQANEEISIAISWLDPPRDPMSTRPLTAQIVMLIQSNHDSTIIYTANSGPDDELENDVWNNNLKTSFNVSKGHHYCIYIIADDFEFVESVKYTLVALGHITQTQVSIYPPKKKSTLPQICPKQCQNKGRCVGYHCHCIGVNIGPLCQYDIPPALVNEIVTVPPMKRNAWSYFRIALPSWSPGTSLTFNFLNFDPLTTEFYIMLNEVPSHQRHFCRFDKCDWGNVNRSKPSISLDFENWDFIKAADPLFIGVFAKYPTSTTSFIPEINNVNS